MKFVKCNCQKICWALQKNKWRYEYLIFIYLSPDVHFYIFCSCRYPDWPYQQPRVRFFFFNRKKVDITRFFVGRRIGHYITSCSILSLNLTSFVDVPRCYFCRMLSLPSEYTLTEFFGLILCTFEILS